MRETGMRDAKEVQAILNDFFGDEDSSIQYIIAVEVIFLGVD